MVVEMLAADELRPGRPGHAPRHRLPRPQLGHLQPQRLARQHRRAHGQGVPRRDDQLRPLPRPQVRPDLPGRLLPLPRLLRAVPHPRSTACPASPTATKDGLPRVFDDFLDRPTYLFVRGDENAARQDAAARARRPRPSWAARSAITPVPLPLDRLMPRQARRSSSTRRGPRPIGASPQAQGRASEARPPCRPGRAGPGRRREADDKAAAAPRGERRQARREPARAAAVAAVERLARAERSAERRPRGPRGRRGRPRRGRGSTRGARRRC